MCLIQILGSLTLSLDIRLAIFLDEGIRTSCRQIRVDGLFCNDHDSGSTS